MLPTFVIEAYSDAGEVVYEPFGDSGTTLIACERTGRVCHAVEVAPEYVDVAIEDEGEDWPEGEDRRIAQLKVGVEDRNGNVVEHAGEDELKDRYYEASVHDEGCK